jgi:hypothetical protein
MKKYGKFLSIKSSSGVVPNQTATKNGKQYAASFKSFSNFLGPEKLGHSNCH